MVGQVTNNSNNASKSTVKPILNYMDVAKYFFNNKNINYIDNLKLQKLMFFAYIQYYKEIGKYNHTELFTDNFEAWVYGPVLPELYYNFYKVLLNKNYDEKTINESKDIRKVLDEVIKKYGNKDSFELVDITHDHPSWEIARGNLPEFSRSTNRLNLKEYLDKNEK